SGQLLSVVPTAIFRARVLTPWQQPEVARTRLPMWLVVWHCSMTSKCERPPSGQQGGRADPGRLSSALSWRGNLKVHDVLGIAAVVTPTEPSQASSRASRPCFSPAVYSHDPASSRSGGRGCRAACRGPRGCWARPPPVGRVSAGALFMIRSDALKQFAELLFHPSRAPR